MDSRNYPQSQGYPQNQGYQQSAYAGYPQGPGFQQQTGGGPSFNMTGYSTDDPSGLFNDKTIRNAFVSKVYTILTAQLTFTSVLIAIFIFNADIKATFATPHGQSWALLGIGIFFVTFLILACVESARRSFPLNFFLLAALTIGYSFTAAVISTHYRGNIVLMAAAITAVSAFLITMFAKTTAFDITSCGTTLCFLSLAHMIIGTILAIILIPQGYVNTASLFISISGAFLVSLYLMFDTQLILGGRRNELSPEEYILGAIMLYVDIIQLFLFLLDILNRTTSD